MARILVVDDDPAIRDILFDHLSFQGHKVVLASDGREALDAYRRGERFDLIVTDIEMPRLSGTELVGQLPAVRFVVMSGNPKALREFSQEYPGIPIISKPFHLDDVRAAVIIALNPQG